MSRLGRDICASYDRVIHSYDTLYSERKIEKFETSLLELVDAIKSEFPGIDRQRGKKRNPQVYQALVNAQEILKGNK